LIAATVAALCVAAGVPEAPCAQISRPNAAAGRFEQFVGKLGGGGTEAMLAALALGELGDRRAVEHLLPLARSKSYSLRLTAIEALGLLGDARAAGAVMAALNVDDARTRATAADALGRIGDRQATPAVIDLLDDASESVRLAAIEALGALRDPRAVGALVGVLDDEAATRRIAAARALGSLGRRAAERPLARLLRDKPAAVRRAALSAIRLLGPNRPAARPQPTDEWSAMRADRHAEVRAYAVRKLGQSGNPAAVGLLVEALGDRDVQVFFAASLWLGRLGGPKAVAALIETIETTSSPQRWTSAAAALAERKETGAVGPLLKHMISRRFDVDITEAGLMALGAIGDTSAVAPLRKLRQTHGKVRLCRTTLIGVLARLGDADSWAVVLEAAESAGPASRRQAAIWLGYTRHPRAIEPLTRLLADREASVRAAAATALGNIRRDGPKAAAALSSVLDDANRTVRRAAAAALKRISGAGAGNSGKGF